MGKLPRISTRRFVLRPFTVMDIDRLHALGTQPHLRRFLWDDLIISRDRAAEEVERGLENAARHGIGYWVVESQKGNDMIGFCGFRLIGHGPEIELMYGLERAHWGKGLATEASRAALAWLWSSTRYQRVYARTDPPNTKAIAVMQRLGMQFDGASPTLISYVLERVPEVPQNP
jgi:ribosomal-protein-alanine N-acetyltransferase